MMCTFQSIQTDIPFQIWEAVTTDPGGGTPYLLTRLVHNKPIAYLFNFFRCYFSFLSPAEIAHQLGPYLTIALIVLLFFVWKRGGKAWTLLKLVVLIYPLIFIFELKV